MTLLRRFSFLFVLAYFIFMIRPGLTTLFSPDDMMNMHVYWSKPVWQVAKAIALVATSFYRPMGGAFYLPVYHFAGLHPAPYRAVIFCLLCVNCWLLYCLGKRLSGSRLGGMLTALIGSYHAGALGVFLSTAVIYDVLCYGFLSGALLYYVRIRQAGRTLQWRQIIALVLLYAGAVDSKEAGVILPALLLVYELLYVRRFRIPELLPIVACGVLAVAFVIAVMFGPGTLTHFEAYKPVWTAHQFLLTTRTYAGMLLFRNDMLKERTVELFWIALFALSAFLRRRDMLFGAALALIAYLPLNFVPVREGYALYIPLIGFSLWTAGLLDELFNRLPLKPPVRLAAAALLILLVTAGMLKIHYKRSREQEQILRSAQQLSNEVIAAMHRLHPRVEPGSRVLFVDNPWGEGWDMYFIAKLYFNDKTLQVAMTWPGKDIPYGDAHTEFNHIFRWVNGAMVQVK